MSDFDLDPTKFGNLSQPLQPGVGTPEADPLAQQEDSMSAGGYLKDIALAVPRGIEGAVQDTWKLADYITGDSLPNYDRRVLGESETMVGGFVEGTANFLSGFVAPYAAIGKLGKIKGVVDLTFKAEKAYFAEGAIFKGLAVDAARGAAAGAVADFVVFGKQDGNLSDLLNEYAPSLANPVSDYLASDETDTEIEGRLKNVLDGVFFGSVTDLVLGGIRYAKARNKVLRAGGSIEAAVEAAEKAVPPQQLIDGYHRSLDAQYPGTVDDVVWKGRQVKDWSPEDFKEYGDANGVENFGPLSELKDVDGVQIPGGTDGTFTFYDMAWMRANPIDTRNLTDDSIKGIYTKLAASATPAKGDTLAAYNRMVFSMLSPGTTLHSNEVMAVMARARSKEEVERLGSMIDWEPGELVSKERRLAASKAIAKAFGWQNGASGGLGLRNSVDLSNLAELSKLWTKNPDWFVKSDTETWQAFAERTMSQVRGLGAKTASFGSVWQDPLRASVAAIDRHMAKENFGQLFESKTARREWEKMVVEEARAGGVKAKNFDEVLTDRHGSMVFTKNLMNLVFDDRVVKATGRNVPEGVRDIKWINRPKVVRTMSDAYRRAMAHNDELAKELGMSSFVTQWSVWDRRRGRLEPHYSMFPNLERIPRMSVRQIADSLKADAKYGLNSRAGKSVGLGELNMPTGRTEDVSSTVKFSPSGTDAVVPKRPVNPRSWYFPLDDSGLQAEFAHARIRERGPMYSDTLKGELDAVRAGENFGRTFMFSGDLADDTGLIVSVYSENIPVSQLTPARIRTFAAQFPNGSDLANARIGVFRSPDGKNVSLDFNVVLGQDERSAAAMFSQQNGQRSYWDGTAGEEVVVNDVQLGVSTIDNPHDAVNAAYALSSGSDRAPFEKLEPLDARTVVDAQLRNIQRGVAGFIDVQSPQSDLSARVAGALADPASQAARNSGADHVYRVRRSKLVRQLAKEMYGAGDDGAIKRTLRETIERDTGVPIWDPALLYMLDNIDSKMFSDVSLSVLERIGVEKANGLYNFIRGEIRISQDAVNSGHLGRVTTHEMWHHISTFLSDDDLKIIEDAFRSEREAAIRANPALGADLRRMEELGEMRIPLGDPANYRYVSIDEWFAEKGADRTAERAATFGHSSDDSVVTKVVSYIRQWTANLMNTLRYKFGDRTADVVFDRFFHTKDAAPFSTLSLQERVGDGVAVVAASMGADSSMQSLKFMRQFFKGVFQDPTKVDEIVDGMAERIMRVDTGDAPPEGLNPRNLDASELIAAGMKGGELNLTNYMLDDGPLQFLRQLELMFDEDMDALVPGLKTEDFETTSARGLIELTVMTGGDVTPEAIQLAMRKYAGRTLLDARRVTARTHAIKLGLSLSTQQLSQLADKILTGEATDAMRADLLQKMQFHTELIGIVKGIDAEKGRSLGFNRAPIDILTLDKANFEKLMADAKQRGNVDDMARALKDALGDGGRNGIAAVSRMASNPAFTRGLNMLFEYWYGAILSGPKTFSVNALGSILTSVYLPMERILGGAIRGDSAIIQQSLGELRKLVTPTSEILHVASQAAKRGESILDPSQSVRESIKDGPAITARNAGLEGVPFFGAAVDWLGKAVRTPGTILQYTDEVVKQANYRAVARQYFSDEAMRLGKSAPLDVQNHVEQQMDKLMYQGQAYTANSVFKRGMAEARRVDPQGSLGSQVQYAREYTIKNFDKSFSSLSQVAVKAAEEATFQTPLASGSISATMAYVVNRHPMLRFVAPFVKTPVNILNFSLQRLDALSSASVLLSKTFPSTAPKLTQGRTRFLQDIYGPNATPRTKAEALGRLAAGTSVAMTGIYLASSGAITGRGPSDPETRQILQQAGWMPYSIRVGNSYVSYQKMDPFSTMIGIFADIYDFGRFDGEGDPGTATQLISAVGISMANNFTNKSYLTGITNFMEAMSDPERFVPKLVQRYAGSFIPSALNQSVSSVGGDEYVREVRTMLDAMSARVPGLSSSLPPVRNMLGEPVKRLESAGADVIGQWADMWVPVAYQEVKSDTLSRELAVLKYPFSAPRKTRNGLDLTEFKNGSGQDAYDRWNENIGRTSLGNKTLRARLTELVQSARYQRMSPVSTDEVTSPRVREIKTILERYKSAAWDTTVREFPELQGAYSQSKTMSIQARLGITPQSRSN